MCICDNNMKYVQCAVHNIMNMQIDKSAQVAYKMVVGQLAL